MDCQGLEEPAIKTMGLKEELANANKGRKEQAVRAGTEPGSSAGELGGQGKT